MKKKELKKFGIWLFEQRGIDIEYYGVKNCIDELLNKYLNELD